MTAGFIFRFRCPWNKAGGHRPPLQKKPSEQVIVHTPQGKPSNCHAASISVQITETTTTYGNINATTVPTPASFWYLAANETIKAKYAFNGVIAFIGESATLYAANTASGATFKRINSGTNTGAKIAHFGMAPVIIRSSAPTTRTKPISNGSAPSPAVSRASPIFTAAIVARLLKVKYARNWLMTNNKTIKPANPAIAFSIALTTSAVPFMVP